MKRRELLAGLGGMGVAGRAAAAPGGDYLFYAGVGSRLFGYELDPAAGALRPAFGPYATPEDIQSCWQHPVTRHLYVASSDEATRRQGRHFLSAFRVLRDGSLERLGADVALAARPIFLTVDHTGRFVLTAYNRPASVSVHAIRADGAVGEPIAQPPLDLGVYPHQVRMFPSNRAVLVPARGNDAGRTSPEDPGSVRVLNFAGGQLSERQVVAPGGGRDFRPRHGDFHPSGRWLYLDLESQNRLQVYGVADDRLTPQPLFDVSTLRAGTAPQPGQLTSAIAVHPGGGHVYVVNRATGVVDHEGVRVRNQGEDSVAVFDLDRRTGQPRHVQTIDIPGVHARTMSISPDGRWLTAASVRPAKVLGAERVKDMPAGITLFGVGRDGRLTLRSTLAIEPGVDQVFWAGPIRRG